MQCSPNEVTLRRVRLVVNTVMGDVIGRANQFVM